MTDNKLLKLAAKAINGIFQHAASTVFWDISDDENHVIWNPLTDDGDALRLAVKLHIALYINHAVRVDYRITGAPTVPLYEAIEPDPYAATRRAIVRAAAEIGKTVGASIPVAIEKSL